MQHNNQNINLYDIQAKYSKLSPNRHLARIHSDSDLIELNQLIHTNPSAGKILQTKNFFCFG